MTRARDSIGTHGRAMTGPSGRRRSSSIRCLVAAALMACAAIVSPVSATEAPQRTYASPEAAVDALVAAARADRTGDLVRMLGPDGRKLVSSGDAIADREGRQRFVAVFAQKHEIEKAGESQATLVVGNEEWPFPIPIVRVGAAWRFDTKAGEQEILRRRIGRNELGSIEVCRAYVDAQREYAAKDRNGDGILEYAQKFISSKGKQDGLFWETKPGELESPMGSLVASARAEGYQRQPYHGYYFKILRAQGKNAPGGAYSYMAHGRMIGGFALVAYPAEWGNSGIMTFIVNQDGVVYQKNLGPDTHAIAQRMTSFDPDSSWNKP